MTTATATGIYAERIAAADWEGVARELDAHGCALLPRLRSFRRVGLLHPL